MGRSARQPISLRRHANVDHTIVLRDHQTFQKAYDKADMVLADGHPIVWASRLLGQPVPERVPGSDLVPTLFGSVAENLPLKIYLLGAADGVRTTSRQKYSCSLAKRRNGWM